uniref:Sigma factor sigB regulation protein rsbQ n=1 Tax=Cajanus cajan TaxID=3821 RepID=A0A151T3H8_CAJCA|nr:Sigma factor sigB regulation protein rsbQ [Cajanus cajan]
MTTTETGLSAALNARIEGCGTETIVFGHGYGTDQSIWDEILPLLSQNYRFVDDLITLLNEMGLKDVTFVGHSMSAIIGCIASVKRPQLFKSLILLAASPRILNADDYEGGFNSRDVEQLLWNIETNYENFASTFSSIIADPVNNLVVDKYEKCLKGMRAEVALSLAKTIFYSDWREIVDEVETPCTIIQTKKDVAVPHNVALYMQSKIKGRVTLETIDTVGHFPQLSAPLEFVQVLKDALHSS